MMENPATTSTMPGDQRIDTSGRGKIKRLSVLLAYRFMNGDVSKAKEMERFLKFAVVGAVGFVVDFGVFNLLLLLLRPGDGSPLIAGAATISFLAAVVNNFTWNRYWTYPDSRSKSIVRQLVQFTGVSVFTWVVRTVILLILQPILSGLIGSVFTHWDEHTLVSVSSSMALVIVVIIVMFLNFFINRFWTYNDVKGSLSQN